jgi:hypothetical protein
MKPGHILLVYFGHVTLCDFAFFNSKAKLEDYSAQEMPEYPAPELFAGQSYSKAADGSTLGNFLYEMLTNPPNFPRHFLLLLWTF